MLKQHVIWITFVAYLLLLVGIAVFERRRNRAKSARSFLTAGGSIKWPVLVMTYLASLMSTWVFFAGPGGYYRGGLGYWVSELTFEWGKPDLSEAESSHQPRHCRTWTISTCVLTWQSPSLSFANYQIPEETQS